MHFFKTHGMAARFILPTVLMLCNSLVIADATPADAVFWIKHGEALRIYAEEGPRDAGLRYRQAQAAFREALQINAAEIDAASGLASVQMRTGQTEAAAKTVSSTLKILPGNSKLLSRYGYASRYAGYLDRSIQAYRQASQIDTTVSNVIAARGQIAKANIYQGRYQAALDEYQNILALHRERGSTPRGKTIFYAGLAHLYKGNTARARALFAESLAASPAESLWSRFARGYDYIAAENYPALQQLAVQLENDNVSDGERRYRLVHFFTATDNIDRALYHLAATERAGNFNYPYIAQDPLLDKLRQLDAFQATLSTIKQRHQHFPLSTLLLPNSKDISK